MPSSGLTLGIARTQLPSVCFPPGAAATAQLAAPYINAATSSLISAGLWRGTKQRAVFTPYDNQITLSREMLCILSASVQGESADNTLISGLYPVTSQWYQWLPGGPGLIVNPPYDIGRFVDQGDGFVCFRDLPSAGTLRVYTSATGESGSFHVRGISGGQPVFTGVGGSRAEGENMALPSTVSSVTSATTFDAGNSISAIVKPTTNGVLTLYHVDSLGAETLIGRYFPGETAPCYRRYWCPQPNTEDDWQVVALCKRKQYDVRVDNDEIVPGNLGALELAMIAINYRRNSEMSRYREYLAEAVAELNSELEEFDSDQAWGVVHLDPISGMGNVSNLV